MSGYARRTSGASLAPLAGSLAVACAGVLLVILATAYGWLGPDADRGAQFCETAHGCFFAQPSNTVSNLGFVAAGSVLAWHARRPAGRLGSRGLTTAFTVTVVLLGPASMAMHATESVNGGHLDVLSMHLIAAFAVAYAVARLGRLTTPRTVLAFVVIVGVSTRVTWIGGRVEILHHTGNLVFALLVLAALVMELAVWRRAPRPRPRWAIASVGTLLVAVGVWLVSQTDGPWCVPESWLQGHALWHLLCALAVYFLGRHYIAMARPGIR